MTRDQPPLRFTKGADPVTVLSNPQLLKIFSVNKLVPT